MTHNTRVTLTGLFFCKIYFFIFLKILLFITVIKKTISFINKNRLYICNLDGDPPSYLSFFFILLLIEKRFYLSFPI